MNLERRLLSAIQHRTARVAIGASAARGRGNRGVVGEARRFMRSVKLARFATRDRVAFDRLLDGHTGRLMAALPKSGATWGLARKLLNIFLRDSLYNGYLNNAYRLTLAERFLEIPLDSVTARHILEADPELPRWRGVRHLKPDVSAVYQAAAVLVAKRERIARVHLDAYWWGTRE